MSNQELKLTQKLFALVERMVNETPVRQLDLDIGKQVGAVLEWDFSFSTTVNQIDWHISPTITGLPFVIQTTTHEILEQFNHPPILDAAMENLHPQIADLDVAGIVNPTIHSYDDQITINSTCIVHDFFKKFNVNEKLFYSAPIHSLNVNTITTNTKNIPVTINTVVKENLFLFRRQIVERQPVELSYLTEKEQLIFWRNAVLKTGQEPKYLSMIGVYTGIPYPYIETEKITLNPTRNSLLYRLKLKIPYTMDQNDLKDIALFTLTPPAGDHTVKKPSLVMVKK